MKPIGKQTLLRVANLSTDEVSCLNIGLMLISWVATLLLPFELFIFSYAILGPLHYLTEISWLHERSYFTPRKRDYLILAVLIVLALAVDWLDVHPPFSTYDVQYVAFAAALALLMLKSLTARLVAGVVVILSAIAISPLESYKIAILLLPTIVHVFVFTGAFILLGALRSRSPAAIASLVVYLTCSVSFFLIDPRLAEHVPGSYIQSGYELFKETNALMIRLLGLPSMSSWSDLYTSPSSVLVTRFIAFAYTYHYLNWFSKTSIIGWHKVSARRMGIIGIGWLACVALYAWDYKLGVLVLGALSLGHVVLEFPLNHQTFIQIGQETHRLACGLPPAAKAAKTIKTPQQRVAR